MRLSPEERTTLTKALQALDKALDDQRMTCPELLCLWPMIEPIMKRIAEPDEDRTNVWYERITVHLPNRNGEWDEAKRFYNTRYGDVLKWVRDYIGWCTDEGELPILSAEDRIPAPVPAPAPPIPNPTAGQPLTMANVAAGTVAASVYYRLRHNHNWGEWVSELRAYTNPPTVWIDEDIQYPLIPEPPAGPAVPAEPHTEPQNTPEPEADQVEPPPTHLEDRPENNDQGPEPF